MGPCIFCFKNEPEVSFNEEHVIPACLHGKLILEQYVCEKCNSKFGREIDHNILKNPDILEAFTKLNLRHNRMQLISHNFKVRGFTDGFELKGKATENGFRFPPQDFLDGSLILPENEYKDILRKRVFRDPRLHASGLTSDQIEMELQKLKEAYDQSNLGEKIEWPKLGVIIEKRSHAIKTKLEPIGSSDVSRLVAKIAYEFGFIVGYRDFLSSECVAQPLHRFVMSGENQSGFHIFRIGTNVSDFAPIHFISFQAFDSMTRVVVNFFGSITYALFAPSFEHNILRQLAEHYNCPDVIGVEYEQNLQEGTVGFRLLLPEGDVK